MLTKAILRKPGPDFGLGLTTSHHGSPEYALMCRQHDNYARTLISCGLEVIVLEPLPGFPDAYFVEDTAVIVPEIAIITRPGAQARRGEEQSIAAELRKHRPIVAITDPGTLDGGDILQVERHFFIGCSQRTNPEGARQLAAILEKHGYTFSLVPVRAGLHLKSNVNSLGRNMLLITAEFVDLDCFSTYERVVVPPGEEYAANCLLINDTLLCPSGFPGTFAALERLGLSPVLIDTCEARKMDGGLTCMSLRL
jgi:dimethylargininase